MGPSTGLDMRGKYRLHRDSIPETVNSLAIRYIDYATRPTQKDVISRKCFHVMMTRKKKRDYVCDDAGETILSNTT